MGASNSPAGRRSLADRQLERELLDVLPAADPRAVRARRDLRRVNAFMGNARIVTRLLAQGLAGRVPNQIAEIGAGDGTFLLNVARRFQPKGSVVTAFLVDQQSLLTSETRAGLEAMGWSATAVQADVFDWLERTGPIDCVIANLFLHHFEGDRLRRLLRILSERATLLIACEPRRFAFPGLAGKLVRLIGSNSVTEHDATASVRAGFVARELTEAWPSAAGWNLREGEAGLFSHWFTAAREP